MDGIRGRATSSTTLTSYGYTTDLTLCNTTHQSGNATPPPSPPSYTIHSPSACKTACQSCIPPSSQISPCVKRRRQPRCYYRQFPPARGPRHFTLPRYQQSLAPIILCVHTSSAAMTVPDRARGCDYESMHASSAFFSFTSPDRQTAWSWSSRSPLG